MAEHGQSRARKAAKLIARKATARRSAYVMKLEYLAEIERDSEGREYDIEIQRADSGAEPKRA